MANGSKKERSRARSCGVVRYHAGPERLPPLLGAPSGGGGVAGRVWRYYTCEASTNRAWVGVEEGVVAG